MTKREFLDIVFALAPTEANAIMDAFDEYVESNEPHWIPVTERLPEDGQEVLVTIEKQVDVFDGYSDRRTVWHAMMHDDEEEKHFCIWGDKQHLFSEVVAWMPLPEPYKGVNV